jgi:hypothetical protein
MIMRRTPLTIPHFADASRDALTARRANYTLRRSFRSRPLDRRADPSFGGGGGGGGGGGALGRS